MSKDSMKAVVTLRGGQLAGKGSLEDAIVARPGTPSGHDLLVEVKAISVNPVDYKVRAGGSDMEEPRILGWDAAGIVVAVGPEVTLFKPGDNVYYAGSIERPGSYSQFQLVDERIVGHKPQQLSFAEAAALPLTTITAWESLFEQLKLDKDSDGTLLVVGATGGVGNLVVQLAHALTPGVTVIATASDNVRSQLVRNLGAHHVVNHRHDLVAQVQEIAPAGVEWIFTAHSENQIPVYAQITAPFGDIVAIDDGEREVSPLKDKAQSWHWEFMFARSMHQTADMVEQHKILDEISKLVDDKKITPLIYKELNPINADTLRTAHALLEDGHVLGKIVLSNWE